jgi:hemerythrin-like metal-binding protein
MYHFPMDLLDWSEEHHLEYEGFDEQHSSLLTTVRGMWHQCEQGQFTRREFQRKIQEFMAHFEWEEQLMIQEDFPEIRAHRRDHRTELATLLQHLRAIDNGQPIVSDQILHAGIWLARHCAAYDSKVSDYLEEREVWDLRQELVDWERDEFMSLS